jgi:hypothetical protein
MRKYQIWFNKNSDTGRIQTWFVSDITEPEMEDERIIHKDRTQNERIRHMSQEELRPRVATFPVSQLYDSETQQRRAKMLCDYLNKIEDARRHAESQTALVDLLTAQAPTTAP